MEVNIDVRGVERKKSLAQQDGQDGDVGSEEEGLSHGATRVEERASIEIT